MSTNFVRFTGEPKYSKIEKKKIFFVEFKFSHIPGLSQHCLLSSKYVIVFVLKFRNDFLFTFYGEEREGGGIV